MPEISIVIPVYNGQQYLSDTIDSVRAQTFAGWELVIVDDGSTDGGVEIAQEYARADPRIRVVQQANAGIAGARNRGYAETDTEAVYVIFLDPDGLLQPYVREFLLSLLRKQLGVARVNGPT